MSRLYPTPAATARTLTVRGRAEWNRGRVLSRTKRKALIDRSSFANCEKVLPRQKAACTKWSAKSKQARRFYGSTIRAWLSRVEFSYQLQLPPILLFLDLVLLLLFRSEVSCVKPNKSTEKRNGKKTSARAPSSAVHAKSIVSLVSTSLPGYKR